MLGRDHAMSGALAFAALGPWLNVTGAHLAAGAVLAAGAAVLPDIDHPDSTVARSFGFLTGGFAWVVEKLSGGHRHGTHSLAGVAVFTAGALAAGAYQLSAGRAGGHAALSWHLLPAFAYLSLLYSAALRALHIGGHHGDLLGIAAAAATCWAGSDLVRLTAWHIPALALITGLGCAAHIAGDELTHGGCPIAWPLSRHEFHLLPRPLQFTTNRLAENGIVSPLLGAALALAVWRAAGYHIHVGKVH